MGVSTSGEQPVPDTTSTPQTVPRSGNRVALVLAGAGSRGAYEAGVLSVLLPKLKIDEVPRLILGTSAGALNAAMLASVIDQGVSRAAQKLVDGWLSIRPEKVIRPPCEGALTALSWQLRHPPGTASGLLDTKPLEHTIGTLVQPANFGHNIAAGHLDSVAIVASACSTAQAVVFVEGGPVPASSAQVRYAKTTLGTSHLMGSSAFPVAFPPHWIDEPGLAGDWYIDGGVHLNAPLKPAIDLGADHLLVIGGTPIRPYLAPSPNEPPNLGDSNGQILHALLTDRLRPDLERLRSTNRFVRMLTSAGGSSSPAVSNPAAHRLIATFVVNPADDGLSDVAAKIWPGGWKSALESFGGYRLLGWAMGQRQRPGQFLSYLCFHPEFIEKAIEQGQADARAAIGTAPSIPWTWP